MVLLILILPFGSILLVELIADVLRWRLVEMIADVVLRWHPNKCHIACCIVIGSSDEMMWSAPYA